MPVLEPRVHSSALAHLLSALKRLNEVVSKQAMPDPPNLEGFLGGGRCRKNKPAIAGHTG